MTAEDMTMDHSPTLGALAKALAGAQGKIEGAKKTAQNPHLKNKYATLADVWDACRTQLSASGLAIVQLLEPSGEKSICVVTMLVHESGEWIRSRVVVPVSKPDAQGFGSAITYARRYALSAMVGVAPDDDDGNAATGKTADPKPAADTEEARLAMHAEEARLAGLLDAAKNTGDLAKAEGDAARVAKAGGLTDQARERLRAKRAEAIKRIESNGAAA